MRERSSGRTRAAAQGPARDGRATACRGGQRQRRRDLPLLRISCPTFYKWRSRFDELGEEGLRDRSSAPLNSPKLTSTDLVGKIIYLRQSYHFGPMKISMYLKRYHDIQISSSGAWRVLVRLDMNRLLASQRYKRKETRWKRYEKARPGHHVQIDVMFLEPLPGRASAGTTSKPRSRLQSAARLAQARPEVGHPVPRLCAREAPVPVRHDPGRLPLARARPRHRAHLHPTRHAAAQRRGRRSRPIDAEEFYRLLDGVVIDDTALFSDKLQEWDDFYNFHRPHGGLGGQTPHERLLQKAKARP